MSWFKNWDWEKNSMKPLFERREDIGRSKRKSCVCGGHNHNNPKRNLNHNSTRMRLRIKMRRRYKERNKDKMHQTGPYAGMSINPACLGGD